MKYKRPCITCGKEIVISDRKLGSTHLVHMVKQKKFTVQHVACIPKQEVKYEKKFRKRRKWNV